nr:hypothetical protein [Paenimyroides ceti]
MKGLPNCWIKPLMDKSQSEIKRLQQRETIKRYQFINDVFKTSYQIDKNKASVCSKSRPYTDT